MTEVEMLDNKGYRVQSDHLLSPLRFSVVQLGCIQLCCWPNGSNGSPQTTHVVTKTNDYCPKTAAGPHC